MSKIFIISDDFTGAMDTGVQFAESGARVYVTTSAYFTDRFTRDCFTYMETQDMHNLENLLLDCDVLTVDAETRHMKPADAADVVGALTQKAAELGFMFFYKKTDSALRGNVGAELAAMLEACGESTLAFAPAYPKNGRVTVGGIHYIDGLPLGKSVFSQDPHAPVKHSGVAKIVKAQTGVKTAVYPAATYRSQNKTAPKPVRGACDTQDVCDIHGICDTQDACDNYSKWNNKGASDNYSERKNKSAQYPVIEIYDAGSDDDLLQLGYFLREHGKIKTLAGCAGFAGVLPKILGLGKYAKTFGRAEAAENAAETSTLSATRNRGIANCKKNNITPDSATDFVKGDVKDSTRFIAKNFILKNILIITGSVNPITLKQLSKAEKNGFYMITLSPEQKITPSCETYGHLVNTAVTALQKYGRVIIAAASTRSDIISTDTYARSIGLKANKIQKYISTNIGRLAVSIMDRHVVNALAVFGGDTLYEIMCQAGVQVISPLYELAPGVVDAEILSGNKKVRLITKSGGFGGEDILEDITSYLFGK
jgi:uncharacterized protein YgbK (DUF1537 family)